MARQARRHALRRQASASASASTSTSTPTSSSSASSPLSTLRDLFNDKALQAVGAVDRLSGFRIPFAFLSSLRANLQISSSLEDLSSISNSASTTNTPDSLRPVFTMTSNPSQLNVSLCSSSNESLQSPTATPTTAAAAAGPTQQQQQQEQDEIPPLVTFRATSEEHKIEALRLIADSVAQQRQIAARYLIFRAETLAVSALVLAIVAKFLYKGSTGDLALVGTTWTGCIMAGLIGVRWATSGYIDLAEKTGTWVWLGEGLSSVSGPSGSRTRSSSNSEEDEILVTTFGDEVIGALVLRAVRDGPDTRHGRTSSTSSTKSSSSSNKGNSRRKNSSRFSTGVIRAWTVKRRYRRKEIGTGLLEEAISSCRARGLNGPVFAVDHANSGKVLPERFNGGFVKWDRWARAYLERVMAEKRR